MARVKRCGARGWNATSRARILAALAYVRGDPAARVVEGEGAEVALVAAPDGHLARLGLAVADDEHVRRLGELGVADLASDRLRALVDLRADPVARECG